MVIVTARLLRLNVVVKVATLHVAVEGAHRRVGRDWRTVLLGCFLLISIIAPEVRVAAAMLFIILLIFVLS